MKRARPETAEGSERRKSTPVPKEWTETSAPSPDPLPRFRVGEKAEPSRKDDLQRPLSDRLEAAPLRMDRKAHVRMKRGKLSPEGRIDLHGMTLEEAHPALVSFVLTAHAEGKRLLLVITGKGRTGEVSGPMPARRGVLRHQVPQWLRMPPLSHVVLQVREAHIRHGGHGALYVYLGRRR